MVPRITRCATAAVLAFAVSTASAAVIVDDTSDDFNVQWSSDVYSGATLLGTLKATAAFDVQSIAAGEAIFKVTVSNNTTGSFVNAGMASFSFLTTPGSTGSYQTAGSVFDGIGGGSVPSFKYHTVCAYAANNCNGGAQGDLLAVGDSDTFWLKLAWDGGASLTFPDDQTGKQGTYKNWAIKFQTNVGSFEFAAGPGTNEFNVPSPAPLALIGIGLLGAAVARRRASC